MNFLLLLLTVAPEFVDLRVDFPIICVIILFCCFSDNDT
jgi:hypothetical protein